IELDPKNSFAHYSLCWNLALLRQPEQAMPHCEAAVALTNEPSYVDSRGLAHALLSDFSAAAADFQVYVDWLLHNNPDATGLIEERKAWIDSLERGENPLTPAVLEELR